MLLHIFRDSKICSTSKYKKTHDVISMENSYSYGNYNRWNSVPEYTYGKKKCFKIMKNISKTSLAKVERDLID